MNVAAWVGWSIHHRLGAPVYGEPSADAVIPNVHRALDRGVDLVDTSDIYWHGVHEEWGPRP